MRARTPTLLSLGGNDLRQADNTPQARRNAVSRLRQNLDFIFGELSEAGSVSRTTVLALYDPTAATDDDRWIRRANGVIRDTAKKHGISVAAADEAFRGHKGEYTHHDEYPWDVHPTDEGYKALAESLSEAGGQP
jgi:lysophospholipase L1-like esterase